jgi:hypothetical protein
MRLFLLSSGRLGSNMDHSTFKSTVHILLSRPQHTSPLTHYQTKYKVATRADILTFRSYDNIDRIRVWLCVERYEGWFPQWYDHLGNL